MKNQPANMPSVVEPASIHARREEFARPKYDLNPNTKRRKPTGVLKEPKSERKTNAEVSIAAEPVHGVLTKALQVGSICTAR